MSHQTCRPFVMILRHFFRMVLALLSLSVARAQDLDGLNTLMPESLAAMQSGRWDEALKLLDQATALKPELALRTYGPQFGVVWYRRGICEMKLRRWDDAIRSFETCYRDYPNRKPSGGNLYQAKALLKWGEAAVGAGKWELAISRFRKFLDERDKVRDEFQQSTFYVTLGICHYRLGNIADGNVQLEIAIRNRSSFPTSEEQIMAGVQALVGAAISSRNESALLDFLSNNRRELGFAPLPAMKFATVFLKLANDCSTAGMSKASLLLYQLVPDPKAGIEDLRARISGASDALKAEIEVGIKKLEDDERAETPIGLLKLAGLATLHEGMGHIQSACEDRERILKDYPKAAIRDENLQRLMELRLSLAEAMNEKPDEAIAMYERIWSEARLSPGPGAKAARRWMELLWNRNHEGDRLSACRGGLSFLEMTKEDEIGFSDEDRAAREEVARLTQTMQSDLAVKPQARP